MYKSIIVLLVGSLLAVHADFQFLLTDFNNLPVVQYEQFQHISKIPSSDDTFLVSAPSSLGNTSLGLISYSSLTYTPLELTYNGEKICCIQYNSPWVESPEGAPQFIYTTAVTTQSGDPYSPINIIRLLKIDTASLSVVLAITLPNRSFFVRDISVMDVSPDGSFLYAITVDEHNSTLTVYSTADFSVVRSLPLETPTSTNLNNYGGPAYVDIAAGVEKLYVVSSYYILALDRATLTVQQNFTVARNINFGPNVRLDEAKDALFVSTHDSGYFKYGFIYNLTKLSLNPLALEATFKPQETAGQAEYVLVDHSRNVVHYAMQAYYTGPQQLFTLDIDSFALINNTYLPGYRSVGTFTNSSKNEILIASNNILGRLAIDDDVECGYPIITSSVTSTATTEYGAAEYTFSATIYNPSDSAITELRFSVNCTNYPQSVAGIEGVSAYDVACSRLYRLPPNTVIPARGTFSFTYVKVEISASSYFKIEYVRCDLSGSEPTTPPSTPPTSSPPTSSPPTSSPPTSSPPTSSPPTSSPDTPHGCSSVSIEQSVQSEWQQGGVRDAVYNVFFTNSGSGKITSLVITAGSGIDSLWGLDSIGNGQYRLPTHAMIEAGSRYSWGYIREGEGPATFTLSDCEVPTTHPTLLPPTSAPSTPPTSTPSTPPTSTPSTPPTSTPSMPAIPISVTQVAASTWTENGQMCQQVDVRITNTSPSTTFSSLKLTAPDFANVKQSWNIEKDASNNLVLPSYVTSLAPGATFLFGYVNCGSLVTFQIATAN